MTAYGSALRLWEREREVLSQYFSYMKEESEEKSPERFLERRFHALKVKKENDLLTPWEASMEAQVDEWLSKLLTGPLRLPEPEAGKALLEEERSRSKALVQAQKEELLRFLNEMTDFLKNCFGEEQELTDWLVGIQKHGDASLIGFLCPEMEPLLNRREQEARLRKSMKEMERLYEAGDRK